ncbi:hypothetical protein [Mycolicibacterium tokaiense]|uniref:Transmembrane protein n=1 Tax=Mycolicibacterium tokaiense TaxID=39695 RepID=A0A378T9Y1_9MYCO|nr:hypothetical protein [Mycolicibacterium tokaiense]BBY87833.1 hypothetical protein MTOK_36150 [Mycolicibacterium tokaiense]STZ57648.1 Uncharacterised protein [Mycolicibacterium tokaiense]
MDSSVILGWASFVIAVIGIPAAWFFARRGRQRPDLRSAADFDVIIDSDDGILDRLNMEFDGSKILSVSRTRFAMWNARGDTVRGSDIVPTDQLRLELESDAVVLHARVLTVSREQIDAKCEFGSDDPQCARLSFDFLDPSDGFIVELLHTSPRRAKLVGTIRGAEVASSKRGIDLSNDALDAVSERWFLRFKHLRRKLKIFTIFTIIAFAIFVFQAWIVIRDDILSEPHLVNASSFDLGQLQGQHDFAKAVTDANNGGRRSPLESWVFVVISAIMAVYILRFPILSTFLSAVPRSITSVPKDSP